MWVPIVSTCCHATDRADVGLKQYTQTPDASVDAQLASLEFGRLRCCATRHRHPSVAAIPSVDLIRLQYPASALGSAFPGLGGSMSIRLVIAESITDSRDAANKE